jgi:hypothetical protein
MSARRPMTLAEIKERAPSVFGKHKATRMSDTYTFVPTFQVMETLDKIGLVPVDATQRKSADDPTVARHMVRFAFRKDLEERAKKGKMEVNDLIEELVWENAHNGRSAAKMHYGLFRLICSNGLIVADNAVRMVKRHIGDVNAILAEVDRTLEQGTHALRYVREMRAVKLTDPQRATFAAKALELRYMEEHRGQKPTMKTTITPDQLLVPRRTEDKTADLWTTFNVIQENLIQGGLTGKSALGRATHTRQLNDVRKLVSVNTGLWELARGFIPAAAAPKKSKTPELAAA